MTRWFGVAALAVAMMFGGSASAHSAVAVPAAMQPVRPVHDSDVSARRHHQHPHRYVDRPSYPHYYGRPHDYAPAPFFPIPPLFGYGWEPW